MSLPETFTHLHLHTHYSLLDGATRLKSLMEKVKGDGGSAVAITDHGNMFGVVQFYEAAVAAGIKPIIGLEAYMAPGDRRNRESCGIQDASYHLLLLARNNTGYRNLLKLSSIAYREGFYYKPRIDREVLRAHSEGLICSSACLGGEVPQALLSSDRRAAEDIARWYLDVFGEDGYYLELQDHGLPEQKQANPEIVDLAQKLGIGLIVSNDVHYLDPEDVEAHDVLCCINTGAKFHETDRFRFTGDQFYFKSRQQMQSLFGQYPAALDITERIAKACEVELDFKSRHAPVYPVPNGKTDREYLRELVYAGAAEKYGEPTPEIRERIDYELGVISSKGFCSYFLIVWDFVRFARSQGIPCGARGSGCSTVVGYVLNISSPDPLRYELYFERFMDPDRDDMPDIDVDICQDGRERIIDYVRGRYGHVAQVITYGTLKARAVVKDVARVLGLGFEEATALTKLIPEELNMTIEKAMGQEPELQRLYEENETVHKVIDVSRRLEGLARHVGVHAAGVVISDQPLDDLVPLYKPSDSNQIITQYDGPGVEKVGLLKMDFLGLKTLSVVERARQMAERNHKVTIDLDKVDLTDQRVYELFVRGDTKGVFQFESAGMRDVLRKMRPNRIEDLIAANALYRPGPMAYIDEYVRRKHGENWTTPHPIMSEVLNETYGIMVYQEQVSRLVNRLGGIELKQAFRLAKAISKKKTDLIEKMREPFLKGATGKGVKRTTAEQIFDDILRFGSYAFNKAHSTGYALLAFKTAYMKAYCPCEYMAALLTFEMDSTDKIVDHLDECRRLGIDIAPPDINVSDHDFTVVHRNGSRPQIRFGLGAVKGVGEKAVGAILAARKEGGPFRSLFDFCERLDLSAVNRAVIEALIKCGAFDSTGAMRKALIVVVDGAISHGSRQAEDRRTGQMSLFGGPAAGSHEPKLPAVEWSESEMLAHEKATLGFYVTKHPLTSHEQTLRKYATVLTADLRRYSDGSEVVLGGMISRMRTQVINKEGRNQGKRMAFVTIEDLNGQVEAVLFPDGLEKFQSMLVPESVVFVRGRVDRRRQEPSVRIDEVIPLEDADARLSDKVRVRLNSATCNPELLQEIARLAKQHRGDRPLFLRITTGNHVVIIRSQIGVRPCAELFEALDELLGPGQAEALPAARAQAPASRPETPRPVEADEGEWTEDPADQLQTSES
ncbi:MAG TPA: DNA polymerase III subunit alpha [Phycisphaerae bacterium]|nr:DNA polymerase III subunit alpha [Phycisphaerae bacterium]